MSQHKAHRRHQILAALALCAVVTGTAAISTTTLASQPLALASASATQPGDIDWP